MRLYRTNVLMSSATRIGVAISQQRAMIALCGRCLVLGLYFHDYAIFSPVVQIFSSLQAENDAPVGSLTSQ